MAFLAIFPILGSVVAAVAAVYVFLVPSSPSEPATSLIPTDPAGSPIQMTPIPQRLLPTSITSSPLQTKTLEISQVKFGSSPENFILAITVNNPTDKDALIKNTIVKSSMYIMMLCNFPTNTSVVISDTIILDSILRRTTFSGNYSDTALGDESYSFPLRGSFETKDCLSTSIVFSIDSALIVPSNKFISFNIVFPRKIKTVTDYQIVRESILFGNSVPFGKEVNVTLTLEQDQRLTSITKEIVLSSKKN